MTDKKIWFITGAGVGMGVDIAKAALAAGHAVVATGRNPERVSAALGAHDDLLAVKLDVTDPADAPGGRAGCRGTVRLYRRPGQQRRQLLRRVLRGDHPGDFRAQVETTMFGPINVTRAVLPVMRAQRSGLVVAISSTAGIVGQEFCTAYAAAKFGVEGWIESLAPEVAPFGIRTILVEPGFFRTELLSPESTNYAQPSIDDYAERTTQTVAAWNAMNGQQGGDPPSSPTPWSSWQARTSRRGAGWPVPTPSPRSSRRPRTSWPRPTPTASCRRRWPTATPQTTRQGRCRASHASTVRPTPSRRVRIL